MPKTYFPAPAEVFERANNLIAEQFPELETAGVTLDIMMAVNDSGDAVSWHGTRALALVKITPLLDRAKGLKDACILIDASEYGKMRPRQQDALLHHELTHLMVLREEETGMLKTDDLNRPKLKIKKHDYEFGWFLSSAQLFGQDSVEVYQARLIWEENGQALFLLEDEGKKKGK